MKDVWRNMYQEVMEKELGNPVNVLTGFNANIDVRYDFEDLEIDLENVEASEKDKISGKDDLAEMMKFCIENSKSKEIELEELDLEAEGEEQVGGQAAIMANYLSRFRNSVTFYTPFLSQDLADLIDNRVLYPVYDDQFVLKNVRDAANTDRTKRNLIFEFSGEKSGRLIASSSLKGFGPYFRKGVEENLETIDEDIDRALISGFHDIEGNIYAKLKKSSEQLEKVSTPIHLEYVDVEEEKLEKIASMIFPQVDSLGFDEYEMSQLEKKLDLDTETEEGALGEAYETSKELIQKYGLSRVHVHTYDFHLVVVENSYDVDSEKIRESMLFGELSAISMADTGEIPEEDELSGLETGEQHIRKLDELEDFEDFFGLENFSETGIAEMEDYRVVAIPPIIHEKPERLVGMGDIISSGAFTFEAS